jgi:hypothetical protein
MQAAAPPIRKRCVETADPRADAKPIARTKPVAPQQPPTVPAPTAYVQRFSPLVVRPIPSGPPPPVIPKGKAPMEDGPRAEQSTQDEKAIKYRRALVNGTANFAGIMRAQNRMGDENVPYAHQRVAVKQIASKSTSFKVLAHDMGTGKTATVLQSVAAEAVMLERVPKVLITAPTSTLQQWKDTVLDWLRIPESRILVTNELKKVTRGALMEKDLVIVSRDLLSNAYATYMRKYEKHHSIETPYGQRWVSSWDRIGYDGAEAMRPIHVLFDVPDDASKGWFGVWDVFAIDEGVLFIILKPTHSFYHWDTWHTDHFGVRVRRVYFSALHEKSGVALVRVPQRCFQDVGKGCAFHGYRGEQQDA